MEKIYLTKREKRALLVLAGRLPKDAMKQDDYDIGIFGLEEKGLVQVVKTEGGHVEDAKLTYYGFRYLRVNPKLRNPFPYFTQLDEEQWLLILNLINIILLLSVLLKIILQIKYS